MKKKSIKQIVIGLIGLLLSISIFILSEFVFDVTNKWIIYLLLIITFGCSFGSLRYIFRGIPGFINGSLLGIIVITTFIIIKELPSFWSGIFIIMFAVTIFALPVIKEYLFDREKNPESPRNKKIANKIREQEHIENIILNNLNEFLSTIEFGEKSIIFRNISGDFYQCIKGEDKLYFIYVGDDFSGIDLDLLITNVSDEGTFISKKKDYEVNKRDIYSIDYKTKDILEPDFSYNGSIVINYYFSKKKFYLIENVSFENVKTIFSGITVDEKYDDIEETDLLTDNTEVELDKKLIARLKLICTILTVVSVAMSAAFLFLAINYKVLSTLCIILFASLFSLYVKYNNVLSLSDQKEIKTFTNGRINVSLPIILTSIVLGFRSVYDFDLISYKMFRDLSVLLFVIILFMFFTFTNEYKRNKSCIFVIVLASLFFAPASLVQINCNFDYSRDTIVQLPITEMRITTGSKSPDTYLLNVNMSEGNKIELKVSKNYYESLTIGESVNVVVKEGFLSMPYAFVIED